MAHPDPYASYLGQARALFEGGEVLKAGQIWQAILKKDPGHAEAKAGLYQVRLWLEAQQAPPAAPVPRPPDPVQAPAAPSLPAPAADPFAALPPLPAEAPAPPDPFAALPPLPDAAPAPAAAPAPPALAVPPPEPTPAEAEADLPPLQSINLESHVPEAVPKPIKRTQRSVGGALPEPAAPEPEEAAAPPALAPPEEGEEERYIREGCTLYDMGEVRAAIQKWEAVLLRAPGHPMALGYLNQARRDLGLSPLQAEPPREAGWGAPAPAAPREDADQLLREAIQLEEMGLPDEALAKLRRVLEVDPEHREARSYLEMHARTQGGASPVAPPPRPAPPPAPAPEAAPAEDFKDFTPGTLPPLPPEPAPPPSASAPASAPAPAAGPPLPVSPGTSSPGLRRLDPAGLDQKVRQAERLLQTRHPEEALFAFQMVLMQDPEHARAKAGLERAQAALDAGSAEAAAPPPEPSAPVQPPRAVTAAAPAPRTGPEVATLLKDTAWWKRNPLILGAAAGFLLGSLLAWWQVRQKDARLVRAVQDARDAAATPRTRGAQPADLKETASAIRAECEAILQEDPVRAYHRALHLLRLDPTDPLAAQLRERARAVMANPPPATPGELQTQIQNGDLEAAVQTANKLLQANPEDTALVARTVRLNAALAQSYAARENWTEAREALRRCRALSPEDPAWQGRLKLLDALQTLPKGERAAWIAMLG